MPTITSPLSDEDLSRLASVAEQLAESWWGRNIEVLSADDLASHPRSQATPLPRLHYHDPNIGDDVWVATDLYHRPDGSVTHNPTTGAPLAPFLDRHGDTLRSRQGVACVSASSNDMLAVYPLGDDLYLWQLHGTPAADTTRLYLCRPLFDEPVLLALSYGGEVGDPGQMLSGPCDRETLDRVVTYAADNLYEYPDERRDCRVELRERFLATDCTYADAWALIPAEVEDSCGFASVTI